MDYNNTKKTTFKWQWDILRSSKYFKNLDSYTNTVFSILPYNE